AARRRYNRRMTGLQIVLDASDPHGLARFWAAALGGETEDHSQVVRELLDAGRLPPEGSVEVDGRLAFRELAAVRAEGYPRFLFQLVPEPKTAKNRCHVDLHLGADRIDAELERLVGLGARHLW